MGFSRVQQETGIGPILAWTDCRFRRPLAYPDDVSIGTRISDIEADRFLMHTIIVSHAWKEVAAHGQQRLVIYDYRKNQKATLPEVIRQRIAEIEGQAASPIQ
jgi:acyl-CoA thioester hydrolase